MADESKIGKKTEKIEYQLKKREWFWMWARRIGMVLLVILVIIVISMLLGPFASLLGVLFNLWVLVVILVIAGLFFIFKASRRKKGTPAYPAAAPTSVRVDASKKNGGGIVALIIIVGIIYFLFGPLPAGLSYYQGQTWNFFQDPEKAAIGQRFFGGIQKSLEEVGEFEPKSAKQLDEIRGIFITQFDPVKKSFDENENVELMARIESKRLKEDTLVNFKCGIEERQGVVNIHSATFPSGYDKSVGIKCMFPEGFEKEKEGIEIVNPYIEAVANYKTVSRLRVYTLNKAEVERFGYNNFERYDEQSNLGDLYVGKGRIRSEQIDSGPMNFAMEFSYEIQPFYEGEHILKISLDNILSTGSLLKLKSLRLVELPEGMTINEENCPKFDNQGNLRIKVIEDENKRCETEDNCELDFECYLDINHVSGDFGFSPIRAEVEYEYGTRKYAKVPIKGEDVDKS